MISLLLRPIVRALLPIINKVYMIALGVKPLGKSSIICVELRSHKGRPVNLLDGCEIRPGDAVIKLHFSSAWIAEKLQLSAGLRMAGFPRGLIHYFKEGLQVLASEVADGKHGDITAVYGWTVFHTYASQLGFQVVDLPNTLRTKLAQFYISGLMQAHHIPWLTRHTASRKSLKVKAVWLSRAELLRIYHI